jgi:hypothetical protein
MYRVKQLFGSLTLRDYDGQVAEAMAMVRALNKMTKAGMPEADGLPENTTRCRELNRNLIYSTKPRFACKLFVVNESCYRYQPQLSDKNDVIHQCSIFSAWPDSAYRLR